MAHWTCAEGLAGRRLRLDPVIGTAGQDRRGPVKLFGQHHAGQHVRPDHGSEGQNEIGPVAQGGVQPVGAADQADRLGAALVAEPGQRGSKVG